MAHTLPANPTLKNIQAHLQEVCVEQGWDKNSITEVFLLLTEEVGEVAKAIRQYTGFKGEKKTVDKDSLTEELADVFNYLLEIANRFEIDLEEAYRNKASKNKARIWN